MFNRKHVLATAVAVTLGGFALAQQQATTPQAGGTLAEIQAALGSVPGMFRAIPPSGIAGAWAEFRDLQLASNTALPPKIKELIGLAVSAQVPCAYCVYFHTKAARLNGATDAEINEAVAMAAITRHWSTVLNGSGQDLAEFRREADAVFSHVSAQTHTGTTGAAPPATTSTPRR